MDVRIRHALDVTSPRHSIGDVPVDRLEAIIPALQRWGVSYEGDPVSDIEGQVSIDDGIPFFDIVIGDDL